MDTITFAEQLTRVEVTALKVQRRFKAARRAWCIVKNISKDDYEEEFQAILAQLPPTENGSGRLEMSSLQKPGDFREEEQDEWLAAVEADMRELSKCAEVEWRIIIKAFGDAGNDALEEAEKQIIAEEEIAAQGHA